MLYENEAVDDLQENGLWIIRRKDLFAYGSDAIALAGFADVGARDMALDIGTGTGILPILLHGRTGARFVAVEINAVLADMARRSVKLNGFEADIEIIEGDVRSLHLELGIERFDCIVCNPPYFSGGTKSDNITNRNSTHDDTLKMDELAYSASRLLKNGGRIFMLYPASRFASCCASLINNSLMPKRVKPVFNAGNGGAHGIMLIEAKKGGKDGLLWEI